MPAKKANKADLIPLSWTVKVAASLTAFNKKDDCKVMMKAKTKTKLANKYCRPRITFAGQLFFT